MASPCSLVIRSEDSLRREAGSAPHRNADEGTQAGLDGWRSNRWLRRVGRRRYHASVEKMRLFAQKQIKRSFFAIERETLSCASALLRSLFKRQALPR
ncbi:hypothetical protein [Lysobacter capsici]|uniref:hypothetical protein n=1 Tax=Lysobacter capsici TaxID=435897 RepID=UPI00129067D4|nr:hypothetical protein [Lysobacter capsici]